MDQFPISDIYTIVPPWFKQCYLNMRFQFILLPLKCFYPFYIAPKILHLIQKIAQHCTAQCINYGFAQQCIMQHKVHTMMIFYNMYNTMKCMPNAHISIAISRTFAFYKTLDLYITCESEPMRLQSSGYFFERKKSFENSQKFIFVFSHLTRKNM